ncbi:MAG: glycosyltransferase family 4 protein, partial [Candidatus Pacebacteria bacterium]|nr:glycosyltransferase family 4 protein [Candidatus Paceibacterota bacterium]
NEWINSQIWGQHERTRETSHRIHILADYLKSTLYDFVQRFDVSILIVENALSIPMHVPLGIAITEFLAETRVPAIAHHHDFYWERDRFSVNAVHDFLNMAFPPRHPEMQHVVINQAAQEELSWRQGLPSLLVPNVLDFEHPPRAADTYASDIRAEIGIAPDDIMILQPTRVVPRKGIEHAVKLVQMLADPRCKLVVSHEAGDEGYEYHAMLRELAHESGVDIRFIATRIGEYRQLDETGKKIYTLWDLYPHADLVTYPSLYEGFGNALLEAFYFRKPVLINRYAIFTRDIEPKGFRIPVMEGFLTRKAVEHIRQLLEDDAYRDEVVDHNYNLAKRFYSYSSLRRSLRTLITNITGLPEL